LAHVTNNWLVNDRYYQGRVIGSVTEPMEE